MQASCRKPAPGKGAGLRRAREGPFRRVRHAHRSQDLGPIVVKRPDRGRPPPAKAHGRPRFIVPVQQYRSACRRRRSAAGRHMVGPLQRADVRAHAALQRVGGLRPATWRRRTSRARGRMRGCWRHAAFSPPTTSPRSSAVLSQIEREIAAGEFVWRRDLEDVHFNIEMRLTALVGDAGKRLHTARSRNDQVATDMRLWLRDAIDALYAQLIALRRALHALATASCRDDHARIHASAGGAAGDVRPPSDGVRRDARARHGALRRMPPPRQPAAARQRGARGNELSDRPRAGRARARFRGAVPQFARRRRRSRLRDRIRGGGRAGDGASVAVRRGARAVVESALRLRHAGRSLLHRQLDHAAEEESGRSRAGARQDRRASSAT